MEQEPLVLPKSVYLRGQTYYFIHTNPATKKQKWHRLGHPWSVAYKQYCRLVPQLKGDKYVASRLKDYGTGTVPAAELRTLLRNSKKNAKSRGLEHALTMDDMRGLAVAAAGHCMLSALPFQYGVATEIADTDLKRKRLWAPSLDRLDARRGYVPGNVRLVCFAVNAARQEFGDEVLFKLAAALSNSPVRRGKSDR